MMFPFNLPQEYANNLAAADTPEAILSVLAAALQGNTANVPTRAHTVLVGHDTRASSVPLTQAAADGASVLCQVPLTDVVHKPIDYNSQVLPCGLVTTPQLHWMVRQRNAGLPSTEQDYSQTLLTAFDFLIRDAPAPNQVDQLVAVVDGSFASFASLTATWLSIARYTSHRITTHHASQPLHLDCANGVGAAKLRAMAPSLARAGLTLELYNTGDGTLNHGCGSDYVQKDKALPQGFEGVGVGARYEALSLVSTARRHSSAGVRAWMVMRIACCTLRPMPTGCCCLTGTASPRWLPSWCRSCLGSFPHRQGAFR